MSSVQNAVTEYKEIVSCKYGKWLNLDFAGVVPQRCFFFITFFSVFTVPFSFPVAVAAATHRLLSIAIIGIQYTILRIYFTLVPHILYIYPPPCIPQVDLSHWLGFYKVLFLGDVSFLAIALTHAHRNSVAPVVVDFVARALQLSSLVSSGAT